MRYFGRTGKNHTGMGMAFRSRPFMLDTECRKLYEFGSSQMGEARKRLLCEAATGGETPCGSAPAEPLHLLRERRRAVSLCNLWDSLLLALQVYVNLCPWAARPTQWPVLRNRTGEEVTESCCSSYGALRVALK